MNSNSNDDHIHPEYPEPSNLHPLLSQSTVIEITFMQGKYGVLCGEGLEVYFIGVYKSEDTAREILTFFKNKGKKPIGKGKMQCHKVVESSYSNVMEKLNTFIQGKIEDDDINCIDNCHLVKSKLLADGTIKYSGVTIKKKGSNSNNNYICSKKNIYIGSFKTKEEAIIMFTAFTNGFTIEGMTNKPMPKKTIHADGNVVVVNNKIVKPEQINDHTHLPKLNEIVRFGYIYYGVFCLNEKNAYVFLGLHQSEEIAIKILNAYKKKLNSQEASEVEDDVNDIEVAVYSVYPVIASPFMVNNNNNNMKTSGYKGITKWGGVDDDKYFAYYVNNENQKKICLGSGSIEECVIMVTLHIHCKYDEKQTNFLLKKIDNTIIKNIVPFRNVCAIEQKFGVLCISNDDYLCYLGLYSNEEEAQQRLTSFVQNKNNNISSNNNNGDEQIYQFVKNTNKTKGRYHWINYYCNCIAKVSNEYCAYGDEDKTSKLGHFDTLEEAIIAVGCHKTGIPIFSNKKLCTMTIDTTDDSIRINDNIKGLSSLTNIVVTPDNNDNNCNYNNYNDDNDDNNADINNGNCTKKKKYQIWGCQVQHYNGYSIPRYSPLMKPYDTIELALDEINASYDNDDTRKKTMTGVHILSGNNKNWIANLYYNSKTYLLGNYKYMEEANHVVIMAKKNMNEYKNKIKNDPNIDDTDSALDDYARKIALQQKSQSIIGKYNRQNDICKSNNNNDAVDSIPIETCNMNMLSGMVPPHPRPTNMTTNMMICPIPPENILYNIDLPTGNNTTKVPIANTSNTNTKKRKNNVNTKIGKDKKSKVKKTKKCNNLTYE